MTDTHKKQLETQLWNIANTLRGKMNADEFRDYILGFIFYKYLSEQMHLYANKILKEDGIKYEDIDGETDEGQEYLEAIKEESVLQLGYFLKPSELFHAIAKRGNGNGKKKFILDDLADILNNIEQSTMGTDSEDDFDKLFEDLDLTSTKLGRTESAKNELISKVLSHLDEIDFQLENTELDVLGDAYEYLIAQFASGAGKKAGEFYTPQEVSRVLAKLVTTGKTKLKSVYDPTCGSGSLLLRVAKEVKEVSAFYGQELNRTTYNLARMNMILHGVHYRKFDIRQEDTLERPQHIDERFEAIVANPPFSAKWSANPLHMSDDRFSQYGKLAPSSKADFAFVQHMIYHLADNGQMAVVLPHGSLFRSGAEGHIRKYLIEDRNYLDAVIGLPANIFYGAIIPTCIMVFKKCRETPDDILFIDASEHYEKNKTQNRLRDEDIEKIISTYRNREAIDRYSYVATLDEVRENDYNLNFPRYIDLFVEDKEIDIELVSNQLNKLKKAVKEKDEIISSFCKELKIAEPEGYNLPLLKKYRKGVIQKLLNGNLRFKNENGLDFPEWEQEPLSNFLVKHDEKTTENNQYPVLTSSRKGILFQKDYYAGKEVASKDNTGYNVVPRGFFTYRHMSDDLIFRFNINTITDKGIVSTLYPVFTTKNIDDNFLKIKLNYGKEFRKYALIQKQGGSRTYMYFSKLIKLVLSVPCYEEQIKIAQFIIAIDDKIQFLRYDLNEMEVYKNDFYNALL